MTLGQGGYVSCNGYTTLTADRTAKEVSDDDTAETITNTINSHMAHLSQQTAASLEANASQINTSLQQLATINAQLHQQQQLLMQQMVMPTTNTNVPRTE